jgi:alpha-N-acetylglucosaminidase
MKKSNILLTIAAALAIAIPSVASAQQVFKVNAMLDPATDKPGEPWCYLDKSTTCIGVPGQPDMTQVTFDGALYTRNAELCFFTGDKDTPLLARGKTFLEGWIPVVQYAWRDGGVAYDIEFFSAPLAGENAANTVNFVRLRMRNDSPQATIGSLGAALRHTAGDCRLRPNYNLARTGTRFSPDWRYEMTDAAVIRDGKLAFAFTPGAARENTPGRPYFAPFVGKDLGITPATACCLVRYRKELKPGESFCAVLKMPRVPTADPPYVAKLAAADYDTSRAGIIAFWKDLCKNVPTVEIPEKRIQDAYRAALTHLLLSVRGDGKGNNHPSDGLPYPEFFLTSVPEMTMFYLSSGLPQYCTGLMIPRAIGQQKPNGLFYDWAVSRGRVIPATQGHILYSIAQTILFTHDKTFGEKVWPHIKKGVAFLENSIATDKYGLLPECWPYDAEMIDGHYTGQNFFALMGLRHCVRVARLLGKAEEAAAWTKLAVRYEANILKAVAASVKPDGYIPTGLYAYKIGKASSRPLWQDCMYDADWENMITVTPTEILTAGDPRAAGTQARVRRDYVEGVMSYRHGFRIHQYITSNMIEQYLARGETRTALMDFYHQVLHSGPTLEAFECGVVPWADRRVDPGCPPPHVWGTVKQGLTVRKMLLLEYGGKCGLEPGKRELWVLHCLSPAWVKTGEHVAVAEAPTEFGKISARIDFQDGGAELTFRATYHETPAALRFRIPYFKELVSFHSDAKSARRDGDCLLLSPDATRLTLTWRDKPGVHLHTVEDILAGYRSARVFQGIDKAGRAIHESPTPFLLDSEKSDAPRPLSFDLVRETFQHEYARRAAEHVKKGGKLNTVAAPPISTLASPAGQAAAQAANRAISVSAPIAAQALVARVLPEHADRFVCEVIPQEDGKDVFEFENRDGKIVLRGNDGVSMAMALNWYLRYEAKANYDWLAAGPLTIQGPLPLPKAKVHHTCAAKERFFLNYCTYGYTMPWWNEAQWTRFVDWMAMNGINRPLMQAGTEAVWLQVWTNYGIPAADVRVYFGSPAHLPWHRMANHDKWEAPLPVSYIDGQKRLQQKILAQARGLGMKAILPAFAGHVPEQLQQVRPTAKIKHLAPWSADMGPQHATWFLDPKDPLFPEIQAKFLKAQVEIYGTDHLYGTDPFNEMQPPSWEPAYLASVAKTIHGSMDAVDPGAVWYQMSWTFLMEKRWLQEGRLDTMTKAVPHGKLVYLDYLGEETESYRLTQAFHGAPFIWNYLGNFGGQTHFVAPVNKVAKRVEAAAKVANCIGVGGTLEGLNPNEAIYAMLLEQPWHADAAIDLKTWLPAYAASRAGRPDPAVIEAWNILATKVFKDNASTIWGHGVAYQSRPVIKTPKRGWQPWRHVWTDPAIPYDNRDLAAALERMLTADPACRASDSYRFDVVNLTRQTLGNLSARWHAKMQQAVAKRDLDGFTRASTHFLEIARDVDALLATRHEFLLGRWIADSRSWAATPAETDLYERNAREILTIWNKPGSALTDYANRQWNGLISSFYAKRWDECIRRLEASLKPGGKSMDWNDYNRWCMKFEADWVASTGNGFPAAEQGDAYAAASRLFNKYRAELSTR